LLRVAKEVDNPTTFCDYAYSEGKYRYEDKEIDAEAWLPKLQDEEKPLSVIKNAAGTDHEKALDSFWKLATSAITWKGKPTLAPTVTLVYKDSMEIFDLSPYVYSDLAGLGLASFIDQISYLRDITASIITLIEQESNDEYYLIVRYAVNELYIIRSSKLDAGSVSPFEESIAHAQPIT
jgi:hypothetical protein